MSTDLSIFATEIIKNDVYFANSKQACDNGTLISPLVFHGRK